MPNFRRLHAAVLVSAIALSLSPATGRSAPPDALRTPRVSPDKQAKPDGRGGDPAARGLDVFMVGPSWAVRGAPLTFVVRAVGYRTVTGSEGLGGATVSAMWDPVKAPDAESANVTTDSTGRATLAVSRPAVDGILQLLVTIKHGAHERTRSFDVNMGASREVDLIVPDSDVIPGSRVGAWVRVRDTAESGRIDGLPIIVEMLDGGVARDRVRVTTDATGSALASLRVPDLPRGGKVAWSMRATLADGRERSETSLSPREEVAALPWMLVAWDERTVFAGKTARGRIRLRDASGDPIANEKIEWVVTPVDSGEDRPDDDKRKREATTDADGTVFIEVPVPTVAPGASVGLRLTARTARFERELTEKATVEVVAQGSASLEAKAEGRSLVPGVPQRIFLRARGDDGRPIVGAAHVSGDGLDANVTLDAHGEAELSWTPPIDVGSRREVGGCARSVAASIALTEPSGLLARRGNRIFDCLVVDRDREARLEIEPPLARAGQTVRVRVIARDKGAARRPFALEMQARGGGGTPRALWIDDGERGADVVVPAGPSGPWTVAAHAPRDDKPALVAAASLVVVPTMLPKITAKIVGGRIAPSGEIDIEARLTDDGGKAIEGMVAAVVFDAYGGGSAMGIERLDAHIVLCEAAGVSPERCPDMWKGDAAAASLLRSGLSTLNASGEPRSDPGGTARAALDTAFNETLRSLEGAVFQATSEPDRLADARRDRRGARTFNPELFRIVTEALPAVPVTPGGEPLELRDLVAVDPQVQFDTVARRVTRLKVFRVLSAVRQYRQSNDLDLTEPALADPNLLLGLMTTRGDLAPSALLDPWGGTMSFRKAVGGSGAPPIASLPGWELASPGPDGRLGSVDDVVDPFARVVKSGTPYARALGEDAIVLARADMRLHDATIESWSTLLEEKTGTTLGNAGFGSGHGRLGGSHRSKPPSLRMGATSVDRRPREPVWSLPTRTKGGVARLRLPLGEVDTTYRVIIVGLADGGELALTQLDIPITTPIAARIETGSQWTAGDVVEVAARVRNRTASPVDLVASFTAKGAAAMDKGAGARIAVTVPAHGAEIVRARVRGAREGEAEVALTLTGSDGRAVDAVRSTAIVVLPGRPVVLSRSRFISGETEIPSLVPGSSERRRSPARIAIEGGTREALLASLASLEPDRLGTGDALADAIEVATRVELFAKEDGDTGDDLVARAKGAKERARGRLAALQLGKASSENRRAYLFTDVPGVERPALPCGDGSSETPNGRVEYDMQVLESEPADIDGASAACWTSVAESVKREVMKDVDPVAMARLVSAFSERSHHREDARLLGARLAREVSLDTAGRITLSGEHAGRRESRARVYAALLRASANGAAIPASKDVLVGWLLVQRDAGGGFGSPMATRMAVGAIVAETSRRDPVSKPERASRVAFAQALDEDGDALGPELRFDLSGRARRVEALSLDPRTAAVRVRGPAGGALVRLEQDILVTGQPSSEVLSSAMRLDVAWPRDARAGKTGSIDVKLWTTVDRARRSVVTIPLPPGVSLAETTAGVRAVPGALLWEGMADLDDAPIPAHIPVRFALAGDFAVPEASAKPAAASGDEVFAASPRLVVRR